MRAYFRIAALIRGLRPAATLAALMIVLGPAACLLPGCARFVNYTDPAGPVYSGSFPGQEDPDPALRVVTFNIQYARNIDGAIALLEESPDLEGADILFLQEMDAEGTRSIARALGMHYVYYPAVKHPGAGHDFGNAILSRWPIRDPEKVILPHRSRFGGSQRIATAGTVEIEGKAVRLYSVHVALPYAVSMHDRREQLLAILEDARGEPDRVIIAGDMNSHSLGRFFSNMGLSWLSRDVGSTRLWFDLDHIFVRGFHLAGPESIGVVRDNRGVSDHKPVWALLQTDSVPPLPEGGYIFARLDPLVPIDHFAWIDSTFARGGRPGRDGIEVLKKLGFRTVVNFTSDDDERRAVEQAGMNYVELPITAHLWSSPPTEEQVRRFFEIALDPGNRPLYIHCARGKDRTGMMAGIYRIEAQGWTNSAAVEEMLHLGYHIWYDDLIDYVRQYEPKGY